MRLFAIVALIVTSATLLTGCPQSESGLPPPIAVGVDLGAEYLAVNVTPVSCAAAADGRVFFTDKNAGQIRVIKNGVLLETPFATVPVNFAGDRGLLGIALHPEFAFNHRVYVFYTRSDTGLSTDDPRAVLDHRVVYFEADGDVAAGGELFVATLPAAAGTTRIGGRLAFLADKTLLVATGDAEDQDSAQDSDELTGKVLRYTEDGAIPTDNPLADSPVYARGVREPTGLSIDPVSSAAFLAERASNGSTWEINRIAAGADYGWPALAGKVDTAEEEAIAASHPDYVDPAREFGTALLGIAFNNANKYGAALRSNLFLGATDGRVQHCELSADRLIVEAPQAFASELPAVTDLAITPAGTLYVLAADSVLRLVPTR